MMRNRQNGKIWALLAMLLAGVAVGYLLFGPTKENLDKALEKGHVSVGVAAKDESAATFTLTRLGTGLGNPTVVIPAGTAIRNSDAGGQHLMTARAVTIRFADGQSKMTVEVETYCLNQFAIPPTLQTSLSIPGPDLGGSRSYTEELESVRKLADCLAEEPEDRGGRQLAVWMIADGLTGKHYNDVAAMLERRYSEKIGTQLRAEFAKDLLPKLRAQWPNLTDERLGEEIAIYERDTLAQRIDEEARKRAQADLKGFVSSAKPMLERCGHKASEMEFFRTASAT